MKMCSIVDFTPEYVEPSSVKPRKSSLTLDGTPVEPRYLFQVILNQITPGWVRVRSDPNDL